MKTPVDSHPLSRLSRLSRFESFPVKVKPGRVRISCRPGRNGRVTFRRLVRVIAHEYAVQNPPSVQSSKFRVQGSTVPSASSLAPCSPVKSDISRVSRISWFLLACGSVALLTTGCQILSYTSPDGEHFTRSTIGTKTSIAHLSVQSSTNGMHKVDLKGYNDDQTEALGVITDAAIKAAISAAK